MGLVLLFLFLSLFVIFGFIFEAKETALGLNMENILKEKYLIRNSKLKRTVRDIRSNKMREKILKFRRKLGDEIAKFEKRSKQKKKKDLKRKMIGAKRRKHIHNSKVQKK